MLAQTECDKHMRRKSSNQMDKMCAIFSFTLNECAVRMYSNRLATHSNCVFSLFNRRLLSGFILTMQ